MKEETLYQRIIEIMDIQEEPEYIVELNKWIAEIGIQDAYEKIQNVYPQHIK